MWNCATRKKFLLLWISISIFQGFFSSIKSFFFFWVEDWTLSYNSMKFWDFSKILSPKSFANLWGNSYLVYAMFIINNHAPFHLWWKKTLVKYQKCQNITTMILGPCQTSVIEQFTRMIVVANYFYENYFSRKLFFLKVLFFISDAG